MQLQRFLDTGQMKEILYLSVYIYLYMHIYYEISLAVQGHFSESQFPGTQFSQRQGVLFLHYQHSQQDLN